MGARVGAARCRAGGPKLPGPVPADCRAIKARASCAPACLCSCPPVLLRKRHWCCGGASTPCLNHCSPVCQQVLQAGGLHRPGECGRGHGGQKAPCKTSISPGSAVRARRPPRGTENHRSADPVARPEAAFPPRPTCPEGPLPCPACWGARVRGGGDRWHI